MFDIGFFELVLLSVVSLVVLGPERLPGAIRTVSLWIGRLRRSFNTIKQDIEKEIGADEIRRQLRNEAIMDKFKHTKTQVNDTLNTVKKEAESIRKNVELEAQAAAHTSKPAAKAGEEASAPGTGEAAVAPAAQSTAAPGTSGSAAATEQLSSATPTSDVASTSDAPATETEKS